MRPGMAKARIRVTAGVVRAVDARSGDELLIAAAQHIDYNFLVNKGHVRVHYCELRGIRTIRRWADAHFFFVKQFMMPMLKICLIARIGRAVAGID